MSASWSSVETYCKSIIPFLSCSLMKWYLICIYLFFDGTPGFWLGGLHSDYHRVGVLAAFGLVQSPLTVGQSTQLPSMSHILLHIPLLWSITRCISVFGWPTPQVLHGRGRYIQLSTAWCLGLLRSRRQCSLSSPVGCYF